MKEKVSNLSILTKGIIKENPVLVLLLGTCPTLAVTSMAMNGLGMGLATTFVLIGSNIVISLLKNFIPKEVRLPSFIVIIAGFVTVVGFLMQSYLPSLYKSLGVFLSLITVNCIILARAEMFACKNKVFASILDAIGMGIGFTLALFAIGSIREILGSGTWMGITLTKDIIEPMGIFVTPAGGFFVFGCLIALVNKLTNYSISKKKAGCSACQGKDACHGSEGGCSSMKEMMIILVSAILVDNFVLAKFMGICPFLGVSKKIDSALGMSAAVTFVMVMASAVTFPIYQILNKYELGYLKTVAFILVIATFVQLLEIVLNKFMPPLYKALGVYLPLITTNCAVLGVTVLNIDNGYNFLQSIVNALGAGLGFTLALILFSGVRQKMENTDIPKAFKGLPITLIAAAILAVSFVGFSGVVDGLFK